MEVKGSGLEVYNIDPDFHAVAEGIGVYKGTTAYLGTFQ